MIIPLVKLNFKRMIVMKKSNKLIIISLVAVIAIYGTYKVVFAGNSEQKLVEKVKDKIQEQDISVNFDEDENKSKVKTVVKKVLKKITKPKSDEMVINDDEVEEEDCYRKVYIPGAEELCLDEEEDDYTIVSDGTIEGRKQALAQKAMEIREKAFGGKTVFDDPSLAPRVCKVTLFENIYTKSHQHDQYRILFCNDKEQVASRMDVQSGGIDSDNIEYIIPATYLPYSPSIVLSEDYKGTQTEEYWKRGSEFNPKKELPRDVDKVSKMVTDKLGNNTTVTSTRLLTVDGEISSNSLYEINVKNSDGNIEKYYIGAFAGDVVFSEEEFKLMLEHQNARGKIISGLSDEKWAKIEYSGKMDAYLDERVKRTEKEKKYFQELVEYDKSMSYIMK